MRKYFIIGSQKSGTTWLRDCLNCFVPFLKPEWYYTELFQGIERHIEFFGGGLPQERRREITNRICQEAWSIMNEGFAGEKSAYPCSDRLNPLRPDLHPDAVNDLRRRLTETHIVLIVRDPRAVFNSLMHYVDHMSSSNVSSELDPTFFAENWAYQNAKWIADRPDCIVRYEDLKTDFSASLSRILTKIEIDFSDQDIQSARDAVFDVNKLRPNQPEIYRTGTINEWREKLSYETISKIEHGAEYLMNELRYPFYASD